jgi:hypothetical protein
MICVSSRITSVIAIRDIPSATPVQEVGGSKGCRAHPREIRHPVSFLRASDGTHAASASRDRSVSAAIFACTSVHDPFLPQTDERSQTVMR